MTELRADAAGPLHEYLRRLAGVRTAEHHWDERHRWLSWLRVATFAVLTCCGVAVFAWHVFAAWWLIIPAGLVILTVLVDEQALERRERERKAIEFYEEGIARIEGRWSEPKLRMSAAVEDGHPFANDLDVFGEKSLFSLLCTARTAAGQRILARWLSEPASRLEILARHEAIEELRGRVDLRLQLRCIAAGRPSGVSHDVSEWQASGYSLGRSRWISITLIAVTCALVSTMTVAFVRSTPESYGAFAVVLLAASLLASVLRVRVRAVLDAANRMRDELRFLAAILQNVQNENLRAGKIGVLRAAIGRAGRVPSQSLAAFERLLVLNDLKRFDLPAALWFLFKSRLVLAPLSFLFWSTHLALAMDRWRLQHDEALALWRESAGEFEALCALAGYAYEHPSDPFPEIVDAGAVFEGEDLRHPLIAFDRCVPNSVSLQAPQLQLLIVSGSNMSGKSTLLRTVGINAVLAMAGAPVRAARLRISPLSLWATLRLRDSIQNGESRFSAEVQRIRPLMDRVRRGDNALFLFDELLQTTNSTDRAAAAREILHTLIRHNAIGLVSTHDLVLTGLVEDLAPHAANVHFRHIKTGDAVGFDHRMHAGVVQESNARELLASAGINLGSTPS